MLSEQEAWGDAPATLEEARTHAREAGLLALPHYADRLEGAMALALGDVERSVPLLRRASDGFAELGAAWEAARTLVVLARAAARTEDRAGAEAAAAEGLIVLERLRSVRELDEARELLRTLR